MNFIKSIIHTALLPIRHCFYFFATVVILHSIIDVIYFQVWRMYALSVFSHAWVYAYLLTIICFLLRKYTRLQQLYKGIILTLYVISFSIDVITHATVGASLDEDLIAAVLATNYSEASEAMVSYFSATPLIIGAIILTGTCLIYKYLKRRTVRPSIQYLSLLGVMCGLALSTRMDTEKAGGFMGKLYLLATTERPGDIQLSDATPPITTDPTRQPENVVMIVGESLSKTHCSSYGYAKQTTPRLDALKQTPYLHQFNNATSADIHTLGAFKTLLSLYRKEWKDSVDWYSCPTLLNVLKQAGYTTCWVSNQSKRGLCDNYVTKYAEQSAESHFMGNQLAGMKHDTFDGVLIDSLKPLLERASGKNFYLIHLMGSHPLYNRRYPQEFEHFLPTDYSHLPEHQRKIVAAYDNSVLYNDAVIDSLIQLFSDKETILFYFSDHAEDVFQSSPDYFGHAQQNESSIYWGTQIPFYIYTSARYAQKYPEMVQAIKKNLDIPIRTDNIFYTIMDATGSSFKARDDVKQYSLFR